MLELRAHLATRPPPPPSSWGFEIMPSCLCDKHSYLMSYLCSSSRTFWHKRQLEFLSDVFYVLDFMSGRQTRARNDILWLHDHRTGSLVEGHNQPLRPGILWGPHFHMASFMGEGTVKTYGISAPPSGGMVPMFFSLSRRCGFQLCKTGGRRDSSHL